jgi:hypothetical protein
VLKLSLVSDSGATHHFESRRFKLEFTLLATACKIGFEHGPDLPGISFQVIAERCE